MKYAASFTALAVLYSSTASAFDCSSYGCPPAGNVFPNPKTPSKSDLASIGAKVKATIDSLSKNAVFAADGNASLPYGGGTFSVALTSTDSTFSEDHILGTVAANGTKKLNGNSVYKTGSISKIFTTLSMLLSDGVSPEDKLVKYFPELGRGIRADGLQWDDVTLRSLASQISGLDVEAGMLDMLSIFRTVKDFTVFGLPPLQDRDKDFQCRIGHGSPDCTDDTVISYLKNSAYPVYSEPWDRSSYSNAGFELLGMALEKANRKPFGDIIQSLICAKLGMKRTSVVPPSDNFVKPTDDAGRDDWSGPLLAGGGVFSSTNDLTAMIRGILGAKILPRAEVNRWLKPVSFTSSVYSAYGMPWEIYRFPGNATKSGRTVDVYTKVGRNYQYGSLMFLLPDYGFGGVILAAGVPAWDISEIVGLAVLKTVVAELEENARNYAKKYAGSYSYNGKLNSTLSLSVQADQPGIRIDRWISNRTDMVATVLSTLAGAPDAEIRLYPTSLYDTPQSSSNTVQFRGIVGSVGHDDQAALKIQWPFVENTVLNYGGKPLVQMRFSFDKSGAVSAVEIPALRITLNKTG